MSIGYACLALGVYHSSYKTTRLDNLSEEKLIDLISYNIESLDRKIDYNIENEIYLFRISSDIIPFGSLTLNKIKWWDIYKKEFDAIGKKIKDNKIRVSMHPGQYSVLNSPKEDVVQRAIDDLIYHTLVLDCLNVDYTSKVVLHIGGVYGDKKEAINRFIKNFHKLPISVKKRLIIENDDKNYNIEEVLEISKEISIPVVFDNLHNFLNPSKTPLSDSQWINMCKETWKNGDGIQKVHYSEQDPLKQAGSHSFTINHITFTDWYKTLDRNDLDIMLEVKDKNISAIKIRNCINSNLQLEYLESEWEKYKYKVLEHSPLIYELINLLFKDKTLTSEQFYSLIDKSLSEQLVLDNQIMASRKVWNYIQDKEDEMKYLKRIDKVKNGSMSIISLKNYLFNLAVKEQNKNLLSSYYFAF